MRGRAREHLRVLRGGSAWNNRRNVRVAYRNRNNPRNRNNNIGFRVALSTFFMTPERPGGMRIAQRFSSFRDEAKNGGARSWPRPGSLDRSRPGKEQRPAPWVLSLGRDILFFTMFDQLTSWANLLLAFRKAARGKRGQANVAAFEYHLEDELSDLRRRLRDRTYRPSPYTSFSIHEPKRRLISAARFRDRVVHHAVCNVIEPLFERSFLFDSYANRRGKGTHRAVDRCQHLARRHAFALQLDVRQFFPSIDHGVLREILFRKLEDDGVRWLIDEILKSGEGVLNESYDMVYFPGDDLFAAVRPRGLPIGNLTSQFWANVVLDPVDHFVKRELRCSGYARFVDDLVLFADEKQSLWRMKDALVRRLQQQRLTVHPGTHPKPVGEGISFLGFRIFPDDRRLKRRKAIHYRRRLRAMLAELDVGTISPEEVAASVRGWENHVRYGNTVGLRKAVFAELPPEIRKLVSSRANEGG